MIISQDPDFRLARLAQFDPRAKTVVSLLYILTLSFLPSGSWIEYGLLLVGLMLLAIIAGVDLGWLLRRSLLAFPFMLAALSLPFVVPGPILFTLPIFELAASSPGAFQGASLALRSWIAVQVFILLMKLTPPRDFFWALEALKLPSLLVGIIAFAYRYLQLLVGEADRMSNARRARQTHRSRSGPSLKFRLRSMGGFFGSLLLRGLERSERVHAAMLARGYDGRVRSVRRFHWQSRDTWALVFALLVLAGLLFLSGRVG